MSEQRTSNQKLTHADLVRLYCTCTPKGAIHADGCALKDPEIERLTRELAAKNAALDIQRKHLDPAFDEVMAERNRLKTALHKIVQRPGLERISFSCDAQVMVDWAIEALRGADETPAPRFTGEWACTCGRRNAPGTTECGTCHCQPREGCIELR